MEFFYNRRRATIYYRLLAATCKPKIKNAAGEKEHLQNDWRSIPERRQGKIAVLKCSLPESQP
jgi:hypothetical protein